MLAKAIYKPLHLDTIRQVVAVAIRFSWVEAQFVHLNAITETVGVGVREVEIGLNTRFLHIGQPIGVGVGSSIGIQGVTRGIGGRQSGG